MFESTQSQILKQRAKRMLRYRVPLGLAILANIVFIVRAPWASVTDETVKPEPSTGMTNANDKPPSPNRPSHARQTGSGLEPSHTDTMLPETVLSETVAEYGDFVGGFTAPLIAQDSALGQYEPTPGVPCPMSKPSAAAVTGPTNKPAWGTADRETDHRAESQSGRSATSRFTSQKPATKAVEPVLERSRQTATNPAQTWNRQPAQSGSADHNEHQSATGPVKTPSVAGVSKAGNMPERQDAQQDRHAQAAHGNTITLQNPTENNGSIRFLVNGRVEELQPGESRRFNEFDPLQVGFHRGGEFGDAHRTISHGTYHFVVQERGWELVPVETGDR